MRIIDRKFKEKEGFLFAFEFATEEEATTFLEKAKVSVVAGKLRERMNSDFPREGKVKSTILFPGEMSRLVADLMGMEITKPEQKKEDKKEKEDPKPDDKADPFGDEEPEEFPWTDEEEEF